MQNGVYEWVVGIFIRDNILLRMRNMTYELYISNVGSRTPNILCHIILIMSCIEEPIANVRTMKC